MNTNAPAHQRHQFYTRPEVSAWVRIGKSKLYAMIAAGEFPAGVKLAGGRCRVWPAAVVESWIAARLSASAQ